MFWKLFSLQRLLDSLFDEGWLCLSLAVANERGNAQDANTPAQQV